MNGGEYQNKKSISLSYTEAAIAVIIGVLPLLFLPKLPNINSTLVIFAILFLFLLFCKINRIGKFIILIMMIFLWGCWHGIDLKQKINLLSKQHHQLDITVVSIPLRDDIEQKLKVRIDYINSIAVFPPLYTTWKRKRHSKIKICAGQKWQLQAKLNPLHSSLNEGGFNQQRYQLAQRVIGTLKNKKSVILNEHCSFRQQVINQFVDGISPLKYSGIIYALMFGERNLLSPEHSVLLQNTGLTHLIAISGLHIGMSYLLGYLFARLLQYLFPVRLVNQNIPIILGLIFAFLYAWVSNFAIPATRALLALLLWVYIRKQPFYCFSWRWAIWSIGCILFFDPLSILSDSFWLSSFAVLAILYWFTVFPLSSSMNQRKIVSKILPLIHLQIGLLILLIPIQVILFKGINVMSFFANLWFVPLISWIVVPIIFCIFLLPVTYVQNWLFVFIDEVIGFGMKPLGFLSGFWFELNTFPYYFLLICWVVALVILFSWYKNYIGLLGCVIVLVLTDRMREIEPRGEWSLTVLDIGHGLAVVIEQNNLALLYDTGNRWQGESNAKRQIIPFLKHHSITPMGLILSHNHLDHTGGVTDLINYYPWLSVRSSFGRYNNSGRKNHSNKNSRFVRDKRVVVSNHLFKHKHLPCYKGQQWQWGKLSFEVLWPEKLSEISHNNDSCVIQLTDGYHKILLTGDLEKQGEKMMVAMYRNKLRSDILFAPHHGSSTSSTALFLRTVSPSTAIVSSARYSPWKIPADKVHFRYKQNNIKWLNTSETGQLTLWFKKEKINILRYRNEINPRWYHLWFGDLLFP